MTIDKPTPEQIPSLKLLWKCVFGDTDEAIEAFWHTAYCPDHCRCLSLEGHPAAAVYWLDASCNGAKLAYVYALATEPAHRGKGYAAQLMNAVHKELLSSGYTGAVLHPAEGLFPYYERLGYRTCGWVEYKKMRAAGPKTELRQINVRQYSTIRRRLLPENGIVQEGDTLQFLSTWCSFYEGADFALCALQDGNELVVQEFLGNTGAIPGILSAMNIPEAVFRMPGSQTPFAMYLPLSENTATFPGYLGLALD